MRNYEDLPQTTDGSDLDLLVRVGTATKELAWVATTAYEAGGAVIGVARSEAFHKAIVLGPGADNQNWWGVCVDIFEGLSFRGAELLDVERAFATSRRHNGISVLDDELAAVIAVLKELLNNQTVPAKHANPAQAAFERSSDRLAAALAPMGPKAIGRLRKICLGEVKPSEIPSEALAMRADTAWHAFRRSPVGFTWRRVAFHVWRLRRLAAPPGIVIAVLGTDGAGKSTIIEAISPVLEQATHAKICVRHLRPMLLPPLGRIGKGGNNTPVTDPHASSPAGILGSLVRLMWLWADYIAGYWLVVRPTIARIPTVFLFDRYADDLALDPHRFRIGRMHALARLIPRLVPRPDIVVALHADPEVIHQRKPELPLDEVCRQVAALKDWAASRPEAVLVDTGGTVDAARDAVLQAILEKVRGVSA